MLTHVVMGNGVVDDSDDGGGSGSGGVDSDDIYRGSTESVLVSPSDSYSDKEISISVSGPSSCPTYIILLTTTTYYLNQIVCDFDLRRSFYSRQYFKSVCHSFA